MTHIALALTVLALPPALGERASDPFARFELEGGVHLAVLHFPDAPRQSTFTFFGAGLVADPADGAQLSHLAEHMLVRATDPDSLEPPGMQINGETTADALRLDTYAEPAAWKDALARHVRWLAIDACDATLLEREKQRIAAEEQSTVAGGFTHKWAEAAWNQVVRHGREHAAVHADVARASTGDVEAWLHGHGVANGEVWIASVGPVEPTKVRDFLSGELRALRAREGATERARPEPGGEPSARRPSVPRAPRHARATWDLDAYQYLEWYPLRDDAVERVAGRAAAQILSFELARGGSPAANGKAFARTVRTPEGAYLLLSAALASAADLGPAREAFAAALAAARNGAGTSTLRQLAEQSLSLPDPAFSRAALERLGRDASLVEAQLALNRIAAELALGLDAAEIERAWRSLDRKRMEEFLKKGLADARRSSLLLSPRP